MKELIKKLIKAFTIAFTQNQKYDQQTAQVIRKVCKLDSCCVDVGCHKGKVFALLQECGMQVSTMESWLKGKKAFTQAEFEAQYYQKKNYYFIAYR